MIPNPKTLYLHIGYPKTGTTSIQLGLYQAHHKLASVDYYFPETRDEGIGKLSLHRWILNSVRGSTSEENITALAHELQELPERNIILSAEEIADFNEAEIRYFAEMFKVFEVYIIVYLRRQDLYLQSLWSQFIKMGMIGMPFTDWIQKNLTEQEDVIFTPHYDQIIGLWSDVFGVSRILIRPFEQSQLYHSPLFDFLRTCGIHDLTDFQDVSLRNISPGMKTLEALHYITGLLGIHDKDHNQSRRRTLYNELNSVMAELGWNTNKLNFLTSQLHKDIMSVFEDGNRKIAQKYLKQPRLFVEPFQEEPISTYDHEELSERHLFQCLALAFESVSPESKINKPNTDDSLIKQIRDWIFS